MGAFQGLPACLFVAADQMNSLLAERGSLPGQVADGGRAVTKLLWILRRRGDPGLDQMRFDVRLILKNDPPCGLKCCRRSSVASLHLPPPGGATQDPRYRRDLLRQGPQIRHRGLRPRARLRGMSERTVRCPRYQCGIRHRHHRSTSLILYPSRSFIRSGRRAGSSHA